MHQPTLECKRKGKEKYLYSAIYILCASQSTQAWITQCYLQIHHAFLRKRSPDGATLNSGRRHTIAAYYSSIDPAEMKGWVGLAFYHCATQPTKQPTWAWFL